MPYIHKESQKQNVGKANPATMHRLQKAFLRMLEHKFNDKLSEEHQEVMMKSIGVNDEGSSIFFDQSLK